MALLATGLLRVDMCDTNIEWSWDPAPSLWVNGQELLAWTFLSLGGEVFLQVFSSFTFACFMV